MLSGHGYSYASPDGVAIAAAFRAGIVALFTLAGSIQLGDLMWPENLLRAGLIIPPHGRRHHSLAVVPQGLLHLSLLWSLPSPC